ncbi:uncharacterized protein [Rutidosis leptorrhynchoides]|uniref:uncharacterized protein n=1 Tax=Rutidosis leptorrhynchoides TaxID=125765 RepID=UPI003A9A1C2A
MGGRRWYQKDDEGYTFQVRNGNRKPIDNPYRVNPSKELITFYITNLPDSLDRNGLWNVCKDYGMIVSSYVAFKKSKFGSRFGFVRFANVKDPIALAKSLSSIQVQKMNLFARVARFQRGQENFRDSKPKPSVQGQASKSYAKESTQNSDHGSYANVTANVYHSKPTREPAVPRKKAVLLEHDLVQLSNPMDTVMVKLKDIQSLPTFGMVLKEEGFHDVSIHYIGGLWIWCEFDSVDACAAFKINTNLRVFYAFARPVVNNFVMDERLTWIEISGMPLCAWKSSAFKKVASLIGRFIFFDKESCDVMSLGRLCIAARQKNWINEWVTVEVNGVCYDVHVHEVGSWTYKLEGDKNNDKEDDESETPSDTY